MITFKDLEKFGLSDKEAKVYLACLELGPSTAAQVAQKADVNRATTYVAIESLTKQGLLSSHEKDSKTFFSAEDPAMLKRLLDQQREEVKNKLSSLEELLPGLEQIYNYSGEKPKVRFFEGKEGLNTIKDEILKTKDKKIKAIFSKDELNQVFSDEDAEKYYKRRLAKKIQVKALYTRSKGPFSDIAKGDELRIIPKDKFPVTIDITIFSDRVALSSLKGKLVGVILESREIATTFQSIFDLAWEAAERYQKQK